MIQLQFINWLLKNQDKTPLSINRIDSSYFSELKAEFLFIKEHIDKFDKIPDQITFATKFPQFDFIEVTESIDYLVDELYKDKNKRHLAKVFNGVRDLINEDKIDEAMALFSRATESVSSAKHIQAINLFKDTARYDKYVERTRNTFKYYVKTGFEELDAALGGWDRLEELATIVARPGVGKSWVLLKCAIAAAQQGLKVGLYSGEMTADKVGYRTDTLVGHISNRGIMRGEIDVQLDYKNYIDSLADTIKGELWVVTPSDLNGTATVSDLRAFIEMYNLDILCIDQHSLLEDERHGRDAVTQAGNISRDLKKLQVMKKIPIIAVSQQNRTAVDEGAVLDVSHIAQSDKIGQDSTCVLFLEQKDNILTIHIAKARDSTTGAKLKYAIDLNRGIFSFIPTDNDALNGAGCDDLEKEYEYVPMGDEPF